MRRPTLIQIANGLHDRRAMARRLKCSEETIALFTAALDAANSIDLQIMESRHARRQGGAS